MIKLLSNKMNMAELQLLRKGAWSSTYRKDDICIKKYNFFEPEAIKREILASSVAKKTNINTPFLIDHYISEECSFCKFKYVEMKSISVKDIEKNIFLQNSILNLLKQISSINWTSSDKYWYEQLLFEFSREFDYIALGERKNRYNSFLENLNLTVFIHGDFTVENMGINNNEIVIYDFQHGSWGPKGWDKAYLAATNIRDKMGWLELNSTEMRMAEVIAAVRWGRAVKKNLCSIKEREYVYQSWKHKW